MFQVIYPDEQFEIIIEGQKIAISPDLARRRANGFLAGHLSLMVTAGVPTLLREPRPLWRIPALLTLPEQNMESVVGFLDINAQNGAILIPSEFELQRMQSLIHAIAAHFASNPTKTS